MIENDEITVNELLHRCIYLSIGHAVYTCANPFFSYEQSWDGINYSFHHGWTRGTISFDVKHKLVVGAARNDLSKRMGLYPMMNAIDLFNASSSAVRELALKETLEYLYENMGDVTKPMATVAIWIENERINLSDCKEDFDLHGGEFISILLGDSQYITDFMICNYEFGEKEVKCVDYIYNKYRENYKKIVLPHEFKYLKKLDGYNEFVESLSEMGIEIL